jgi:ATP-dependent helicase/nuclease subunit A
VEEEFDAAFLRDRQLTVVSSRNIPSAPARLLKRVAEDWRRSEIPRVTAVVASAAADGDEEAAAVQSFDWAGNTLRHIGVVTHACLHRCIRERGDAEWVKRQRAGIRRWLLSLGVPPRECREAEGKVEAALLQTLSDPRGRWVLAPEHQDSQSEYGLTGVLSGGTVVRGVVDRTFVDGSDGVRWIVDFKTSTHQGAGLEWFLDQEQERYRAQLNRYGRLFRALEGPGREIRLGLYFPLLEGGWREWRLATDEDS